MCDRPLATNPHGHMISCVAGVRGECETLALTPSNRKAKIDFCEPRAAMPHLSTLWAYGIGVEVDERRQDKGSTDK